MKTETHEIEANGQIFSVELSIYRLDKCEAVELYKLPEPLYSNGGWRIDGMVNGTPAGTRFYTGAPGSNYWGEDSSRVAKEFIADIIKI